MAGAREAFESLLAGTGITVNGSNPWDIRVHDPAFYRRVLWKGSLGVGESYMDGLWDCDQIDEMLFRAFRAAAERKVRSIHKVLMAAQSSIVNPQSPRRAFKVGEQHYDIGDDLYERMLDSRMIYSCAYWKNADDLASAQEAKLDLVCRKLDLKPGMHVLDIGCGWGGAAQFAAERYGVQVTGITISKNQAASATERCRNLPVKILLQDYRSLEGKFDRMAVLSLPVW